MHGVFFRRGPVPEVKVYDRMGLGSDERPLKKIRQYDRDGMGDDALEYHILE